MGKKVLKIGLILLLLISGLFGVVKQLQAATNLEGYWRFDESASPYADSSGNSNTGTGAGNPQAGTVKNGFSFTNPNSLDLNGTDQYVSATSTFPKATSNLTVSAWIYADVMPSGSEPHGTGIVRSTAADTTGDWYLAVDPSGSIVVNLWESDGNDPDGRHTTTATPIGAIAWHHVAFTWNGSSVTIYVDGSSQAYTDGDTTTNWGTGNEIGRNYTNPAFYHWNGKIDDVRIYSRALSSTEISALANQTASTISYDTATFTESSASDGSISTTVNITLSGDTFTQSSGDFTGSGTHYTANNVPSGLSAKLTATSDTTATFTLTGNASAHAKADSISNLEIVWAGAAFTTNPASNITNYTKSDFAVDFNTLPTVSNVVLSSTSGSNLVSDNLTVSSTTSDADGDAVKKIINWVKNSTSTTVLNMPFEGGSTSSFTKDYSGSGNNGTVTNATWNPTGGQDGKGAYEFDGDGDYIDLNSAPSVSNVGSFSYSLWVKVNSYVNGSVTDSFGSYIIDRNSSTTPLFDLKVVNDKFALQKRLDGGGELLLPQLAGQLTLVRGNTWSW